MRILFLTQVLPYPLDAGPKVRAYYTLRHLSAGHEVTLLSFVRDGEPQGAVKHLMRFCSSIHTVPMRRSAKTDIWHLLRSLTSSEPFLIRRDWRAEMSLAIRKVLQEEGPFDAIHADQLWMAPYALLAHRLAGEAPWTILDQHNAVFRIPEQMALTGRSVLRRSILRIEARKLARYEAMACNRFDQVVWVNAADRESVRTQGLRDGEGRRGTVIPIAIQAPMHSARRDTGHARRVTFVGGLHWPPNADGVLWFKRAVWPIVRRSAPEAVLTIIGKDPRGLLRTSASESVEVIGHVEDPTPYFEQSAVLVVPLMAGAGIRVKILSAWALGVPVVSTRVGAEGLEAAHERNILLADTEVAFAHAVIRVLHDRTLASELEQEGRSTAEKYYDWRRRYVAWDEVYACGSSSSLRTCPV